MTTTEPSCIAQYAVQLSCLTCLVTCVVPGCLSQALEYGLRPLRSVLTSAAAQATLVLPVSNCDLPFDVIGISKVTATSTWSCCGPHANYVTRSRVIHDSFQPRRGGG